MAGGGRTYYATGTGRFSTGEEIRKDQAQLRTATRKGELRVLTSFGTTQANPQGSLSKEELTKVLRSGDRIKFGDGTTVIVNKDNKQATINRLVSEGQRQPTPAQAPRGPLIGGQFRGTPTAAPKPATPQKPAPRGQPKPAKPAPRATPKPAPRATPKGGRATPKGGSRGGKPRPTAPRGKPAGTRKAGGSRGTPTRQPQKAPAAGARKGGASGGKGRTSSGKGKGFISSAGVTQIGNRRKGGGGKKDRKRGVKRRKGGRSGRGRSR